MVVSIMGERDGWLSIRFPWNALILNCLRQIPGHSWYKPIKTWFVPSTQFVIDYLLSLLYETGLFTAESEPQGTIERTPEPPICLDDSDEAFLRSPTTPVHPDSCPAPSVDNLPTPDDGLFVDTLPDREEASTREESFLERYCSSLRARHYSDRTQAAYLQWVKRFVEYCKPRPLDELGEPDINTFLTDLAIREDVSASTQNQALAALLYLFRNNPRPSHRRAWRSNPCQKTGPSSRRHEPR